MKTYMARPPRNSGLLPPSSPRGQETPWDEESLRGTVGKSGGHARTLEVTLPGAERVIAGVICGNCSLM